MGFQKVNRREQLALTASLAVCSPSPDNSGLKLLWCVDWLQPLSFLVISFITYSQFTLAPLIFLPQQGDAGCRWLMKNRIGFGVRQTECRHQSQNALIFNNPHLHVYKWYNQGLLTLILPLPSSKWHGSGGGGRQAGRATLRREGATRRKVPSWWKTRGEPTALLLQRAGELIAVGQDGIWHDRSCLQEDQTHQMFVGGWVASRCFLPLCMQLAISPSSLRTALAVQRAF